MQRLDQEHEWFYFMCRSNRESRLMLHDFIRTARIEHPPYTCMYCGQLVDDLVSDGHYVGLLPLWTPTFEEPP